MMEADMISEPGRPVLICGAGPSGLAAAMMLHQKGWNEIIVVERRTGPGLFERGKAFNYQIDGRGQAMLASIGLGTEALDSYGVPNTRFRLNSIGPDGAVQSVTLPLVRRKKKTAYWITRASLLELLSSRLQEINTDQRIRVLYDHTVGQFRIDDQELKVDLKRGDGETVTITPAIVLACDGVNSIVRKYLQELPNQANKLFSMVTRPSPSSSLMYKVIRLPRNLRVCGEAGLLDDPSKSYVFHSVYTGLKERISLFSLPVARPGEERTANIILPKDHSFWRIATVDELRAFLKAGFPQLDIDHIFPLEELEDFHALPAGKFPDPQYCTHVHGIIGERSLTNCLLLGDAAHAFPPDLGLGVNSALEDVRLLGEALDAAADGHLDALEAYEKTRLPETKALVHLVRTVFPHQYNHVPWRFKLSMAKFLAQLGLSKISFGLLDEPAFRLCQDERISYTECLRRSRRADVALSVILLGFCAALVGLPVGMLM